MKGERRFFFFDYDCEQATLISRWHIADPYFSAMSIIRIGMQTRWSETELRYVDTSSQQIARHLKMEASLLKPGSLFLKAMPHVLKLPWCLTILTVLTQPGFGDVWFL